MIQLSIASHYFSGTPYRVCILFLALNLFLYFYIPIDYGSGNPEKNYFTVYNYGYNMIDQVVLLVYISTSVREGRRLDILS